jgi:three-Cys-motif partner protein
MPNVDLKKYAGREQAYLKHCLLENYLAPLVYKVGSAWDSIVYVDAFSGPWKVNDPELADSSFSVAVETLRGAHIGLRDSHGKNVPIETILVETNKQAFAKLEAFAANKTLPGFRVHALCGEFVDKIPSINRLVQQNCSNPFRFIFLDPKGWADIPMQELQPFLSDRSCEVLINLMTRHIIRFLAEDNRADSYKKLFGRPGVLEKLRSTPKENSEQAEQAVREYCRSLRQLCGFKYVSSAVILEPGEESVRYFLVYATNALDGIEVFKQAEMATARTQDYIRHETRISKTRQTELIFGERPPKSRLTITLRERYLGRARNKVLQVLKENTDPSGARYENLFCEAMAFPLVTPTDLDNWLTDLAPHVELNLAPSKNRRKKPSPAYDDRVLVIDIEGLK